ncbi:uncharacterized protein LOC128216725 isoform X1 [Mya arenaria]|uniref:uncharacterized protein LOC128216725 isoform X1 n=1 Tax=Mya arenaria TaxID=6604 RepID=UPI0022E1768D|nr:uncharacterized protein LOC128216725 isoform X1 [Mya arenaria]XP_052779337.1 uncharacterized protein LOC128216725 isoform X1 [Mya arenaria]XP_052779338.1 uncharacterized protein LOC128216725 isoform X1 [Mya arenaria]
MSSGQEDESQLVEHDQLSVQPHLANGDATSGEVTLEHVNPALEADEAPGNNAMAVGTSTNNNVMNGDRKQEIPTSVAPVYYSAQNGSASVVTEPVVIRQPNGIHVIRTREIETARTLSRERPLRLKHIKLLKVFSVVAIVVFFPLGIPALLYAIRCEKAFHEGIMRGNIDEARKLAKRCERCIIFSIMAALLVAVAVFAIVERKLMADDEEYWKHRSSNHVFPAG